MRQISLLGLIILLGAFFRFYKLDWGQGLFTHPDEYHIVSSVLQLSFPNQMHPHFFSYGSFTIYLIYFTKELLESLSAILNTKYLILNTFLVGRFYSALFSTLTILVVYKVCQFFLNQKYSLLATLLIALTPGLIQQAHFLTPESILVFFIFLLIYFLLKFNLGSFRYLILAALSFGLGLATKISILPLGILFLFAIFPLRLAALIKVLFPISISILIFFIINPFLFLDFNGFLNSFNYESSLAVGTLPVFYTRQFINTTPIFFQLTKILPVALGPAVLIFSIAGFFIYIFYNRKKIHFIYIFFFIIFFSQSFLFAKWTRFLAPTFPFFCFFASFLIYKIENQSKLIANILLTTLIIFTTLWCLAFFSIYFKNDVRITANKYILSNFNPDNIIVVEEGNTVEVPYSGNFKVIKFNFYNFEEDPMLQEDVLKVLQSTDYFILQSRRIYLNHREDNGFPQTDIFYSKLFNGDLGFRQIKEFSSFPSLEYLGIPIIFPDEYFEETWSVFDHPVIRVFAK